MQRRHALIVEGHLAANKDVEHDAETPNVDLGTGVGLGVEEFGGGKIEGTAEGGEMRGGRVEVREAKVDDFDVARFGDEDVLDFEICVCNAMRERSASVLPRRASTHPPRPSPPSSSPIARPPFLHSSER